MHNGFAGLHCHATPYHAVEAYTAVPSFLVSSGWISKRSSRISDACAGEIPGQRLRLHRAAAGILGKYDLRNRTRSAFEIMLFCTLKTKYSIYITRVCAFFLSLDTGKTYDHGGRTMETVWYIKKHICRNGVEERTKYPVRSDGTGNRRNAKRAAARGARRNDSAERQVARLLNNNFAAGTDVHIVLEYDDGELGKISEKAERAMCAGADDVRVQERELRDALFCEGQSDLENYIRRVRRACAKSKIELRYLAVTSDMDGKTGEDARLHHHLIVNAEAAGICREKWRGTAWEAELYNVNGDLSALAEYLIRQARSVPGTQRYKPSRTLEQPITTEPIPLVGNAAKYAENEMALPKGCRLLYRSTYVRGACQYIRYFRPKKEDNHGKIYQ